MSELESMSSATGPSRRTRSKPNAPCSAPCCSIRPRSARPWAFRSRPRISTAAPRARVLRHPRPLREERARRRHHAQRRAVRRGELRRWAGRRSWPACSTTRSPPPTSSTTRASSSTRRSCAGSSRSRTRPCASRGPARRGARDPRSRREPIFASAIVRCAGHLSPARSHDADHRGAGAPPQAERTSPACPPASPTSR
jgi:hypothetical protein